MIPGNPGKRMIGQEYESAGRSELPGARVGRK